MQRDLNRHQGASVPAGTPVVRAHLWVRGRVQGVGFRFFVERRAQQLRLAGFVRNLRDRRVEVVVEGSTADVDALIDAIRQGPAGASVSGVELRWEALQHDTSFVIRTDGRE